MRCFSFDVLLFDGASDKRQPDWQPNACALKRLRRWSTFLLCVQVLFFCFACFIRFKNIHTYVWNVLIHTYIYSYSCMSVLIYKAAILLLIGICALSSLKRGNLLKITYCFFVYFMVSLSFLTISLKKGKATAKFPVQLPVIVL